MAGPDIWGEVIPNWIGGIGSFGAAVVASVAFVQSLKTRGGVETLKGAVNATNEAEGCILTDAAPSIGVASESSKSSSQSASARVSPVSWAAWHESRSRYMLRNDSIHTGATARLKAFCDVTPGGDDAASYQGTLPVSLAANESIPFTINKTLVSPSVTAIELIWDDEDGTERKRIIYI